MGLRPVITSAATAAQGPSNKAVPGAQGIFSSFPMASAKYARHFSRDADYFDTMARMYVEVSPSEYQKFISSIPDQGTQQVLQVLAGDGTAKGGRGYIDFLLQSVQQSFQENSQVSETLSDNYVAFFFGQAPPVFQFSGILMNTYQDDWTMRMLRLYRDIGRGSQLARHKKLITITYDSVVIRGAMMNFSWANTAELQTACQFSFNFLVKELRINEDRAGIGLPSRPTSLGNVGGAPPLPGAPPDTTTLVMGDATGVPPPGAATGPDTVARDIESVDAVLATIGNMDLGEPLIPTTDQFQAELESVITELTVSGALENPLLPAKGEQGNAEPEKR